MAQLLNSFEGGSDGTTITIANSGGTSGNAWDNAVASGTRTYDDDIQLNGTYTALLDAPTAGNIPAFTWKSSWAGAATVYTRMYFRVSDGTPTSSFALQNFFESDDTTVGCDVRLSSAGNIQLRAPATTRYTSSTTIAADTWYRLEVKVTSSATVGHMEARLFIGTNVNGTTPDESFGSSSANWDTGDGTVGGVIFGICATTGQTSYSMSVDDIGISDVDWLGSANPPAASASPYWGVLASLGGVAPEGGVGQSALGQAPLGQ
jgi:hypothetical protein